MSVSRYFKNPYHAFGSSEIAPELIKSRTLTCADQILKNLKSSHRNCDGGKLS